MDGLEKDDVRFLDNRNCLFRRHVDSSLHVSVSQFPKLLGILAHRQGSVCIFLRIVSFKINFVYYFSSLLLCRQMDIGLETYETKDLFVRLLTPTFFVIITVLQIHYFHEDFLEITNIEKIG